jgi:predicted small metal-binding protein
MANPNKPDQAQTGQSNAPTNPGGTSTRTNPGSTSASSNPQTGNLNQSSGQDATRKGPSSTGGSESYHLRCADVGYKECPWETRGSSPDEVLRNAEQHGRQQHNMTNIDEETRNKVRSHIRKAA